MPRPIPDLRDALARCYHYNTELIIPDNIIIFSPLRKAYAITTLSAYHHHLMAGTADDWSIAINLPNSEIVNLFGSIPPRPPHQKPHDVLAAITSIKHAQSERREVRPTYTSPEDPPSFELEPQTEEAPPNASTQENL